jgi:hypothetical protein
MEAEFSSKSVSMRALLSEKFREIKKIVET